jgi:hypothetical protein
MLLLLAACPDDGASTDTNTAPSTSTLSTGPTASSTATDTGASTGTTATPPTGGDATSEPVSTGSSGPTGADSTGEPALSTSTTTGTTAADTTAADTTAAGTSTAGTSTGGEGSSTGMMVECSDKPGKLAGPEVVIAAEFAELYTTYELGPVPGIPADARLGGCVISYDDPNTLLIAGYSEAPNGKIYKIGVERGNCDHIVGFTGQAAAVADTPYIDANLIYVKSGLLLYSEWPVNNISQLLPGANAPARTTDLDPLGVANSIGGLGFVPPGFVDEGGMRLLSWPGGQWNHLERQPDGELFTLSNPKQTAVLPNGPGGFAYIPEGSPGFDVDHLIVSEWSTDTVGVYEVDPQGDPAAPTRKDFFTAFPRPWGAYFEPLTGDFIFLTWGAGVDRLYIVQGFKAPPPLPQ